ncbi:caspase-7-like isoform X2 [Drosophila tropicalis]|uniref:caspase-7-like isoform X2 n=1 Tax=Drosophila tropicalis TaxID=46794 RepID=UPI0035ABA103
MLMPMPNQNDAQVYIPQEPLRSSTTVNQNEAKFHLPQEPSKSSTTSLLSKTNEKRLKPANVYIFNHVKFDDRNEERTGSDKDVEKLTKTFNKFNCNVEEIRNATLETVHITVSRLEMENFEEHSALVIVVLSHGGQNETILAKDGVYSLHKDIIQPILKNRTLLGKPKIFFVQACRGQNVGYRMDTTFSPNDVFIGYSTFEGYVAWLHSENGSLFIQTLCEVLEKDGETKDINVIMNKVIDTVKDQRIIQNVQQVPSVTKTFPQEYIFGDYMHIES